MEQRFHAVMDEAGLYDEAVARVTRLGLRLSTPDEWSMPAAARPQRCGGGEMTYRIAVIPMTTASVPIVRSILWGLAVGQDPYMHEWTAERTVVCGGDGWEITHHGAGEFLGWVTLATAYRNPAFGEWLNSEDGFVDDLRVRPILDLT